MGWVVFINRGSESGEEGVGINQGLFVYFDPNDINVSKFGYVRTKM